MARGLQTEGAIAVSVLLATERREAFLGYLKQMPKAAYSDARSKELREKWGRCDHDAKIDASRKRTEKTGKEIDEHLRQMKDILRVYRLCPRK